MKEDISIACVHERLYQLNKRTHSEGGHVLGSNLGCVLIKKAGQLRDTATDFRADVRQNDVDKGRALCELLQKGCVHEEEWSLSRQN